MIPSLKKAGTAGFLAPLRDPFAYPKSRDWSAQSRLPGLTFLLCPSSLLLLTAPPQIRREDAALAVGRSVAPRWGARGPWRIPATEAQSTTLQILQQALQVSQIRTMTISTPETQASRRPSSLPPAAVGVCYYYTILAYIVIYYQTCGACPETRANAYQGKALLLWLGSLREDIRTSVSLRLQFSSLIL
jgi:hypothetical protein